MKTSDIFWQQGLVLVMSATVFRLSRACCPNAISWGVPRVVIYALDAMLGRGAPSHVGNKSLETMPAIANSNAAISVVVKPFSVWAAASGFHGIPYGVFRNMAKSVCCVFSNSVFRVSMTSARNYVSGRNAISSNRFNRAAGATTVPVGSAFGAVARQNSEKRKGLAGEIDKAHNILRRCVPNKVCANRFGRPAFGATLDTGVSVA